VLKQGLVSEGRGDGQVELVAQAGRFDGLVELGACGNVEVGGCVQGCVYFGGEGVQQVVTAHVVWALADVGGRLRLRLCGGVAGEAGRMLAAELEEGGQGQAAAGLCSVREGK
jgi:hypothetical protein